MTAPMVGARFPAPRPYDLLGTLEGLTHGGGDPCVVLERAVVWRAFNTPIGCATTRFELLGEEIDVGAWGAGAAWAVEHAPSTLGLLDPVDQFAPTGVVAQWHHRYPGLHVPKTQAVFEAMLRAVLEQKVQGAEAARSLGALVRAWGSPAPGPMCLWVPPLPQVVAKKAYFEFHPFNIEMKRANTLRAVAARAARLEATVDLPSAQALAALQVIPGIGPWTAATVMAVAHGDANAVPVGDYHLPHLVCQAFTGEEQGTPERMEELLAPHIPHRGRVLSLVRKVAPGSPRRAPRRALRDFGAW